MILRSATAVANPNIAFIKYWGDKDPALRIPANGSISMNLSNLQSRTTVTYDSSLDRDELILDRKVPDSLVVDRVTHFLNHVRHLAGIADYARVESENNFPMGSAWPVLN